VSDSQVTHTVLPPSAPLRRFVKRFEITESHVERTHTLIPDTSVVACFRLAGTAFLNESSVLPDAIVSGLQDRARRVNHLRGSRVLLAVFTEAGAAALLREPMHRMFNQTIAMECLLRRSLWSEMHEEIIDIEEHRRRVEIVERFLLRQLGPEMPDGVVEAVVPSILRRHGAVRMEKLARMMGLSLSALEKRFRKSVGASPSKFAKIVRMRHALRLKKAGGSSAEVACAAGYYDQSHFIKDFRGFTGHAPESFLAATSSFC